MGRRHEQVHRSLLELSSRGPCQHLYQRAPGEVIFESSSDLVQGLVDAKISVCFPASVTHPERCGSIETLTQRYFESMAAGAIVVGHAPQELVEFMGYNPVVEIEADTAAATCGRILASPSEFQALADKNRETVLATAGWRERSLFINGLVRQATARHSG
jgi:hypothetical protein